MSSVIGLNSLQSHGLDFLKPENRAIFEEVQKSSFLSGHCELQYAERLLWNFLPNDAKI